MCVNNRTLPAAKILAFALPLLVLAPSALSGAERQIQISATPEGIRFGWVGAKPIGPAPTVFIFGAAIEEELTAPHVLDALIPLGEAGVLCIALDLPGEGADRRLTEPTHLHGWRFRLDHGEDVAADLVRRASAVLNHLVARGYTDPLKVAVFGTSRGAFMAFHFAAAEPRVRHVAGFAPVTDLLVLREFQDMVDDHQTRALTASRLAARLYDRGIFIIIGSTDYRVSTHLAIQFTERVIEEAAAHGRQPRIELHVEPADGHRSPAGSYPMAARWMLKQWNPTK